VEIVLSKGHVALLSDEDSMLAEHRWCSDTRTNGRVYAKRTVTVSGKAHKIYLHRVVLCAGSGDIVDHINGNTLDNRRENLRIVSASKNQLNRGTQRNSKTGVKGVSWHQARRKFRAELQFLGKKRHLGYFLSLQEAEEAYVKAAKELT